jgi:hypothetical protein
VQENEAKPEPSARDDRLGHILAIVGLIAHGIVGLIYFVAAGLMAPLYGIIILDIGWSLLLLLAIRLWNRRPRLIILIPVAAFAYWLAIMSLGGALLGWTA